MKDEFHHKISLFKKYLSKFSEEELVSKLGLKKWEHEYIRKKLESEGFLQERS